MTEATTEATTDDLRPPQFDAPKDAPSNTAVGFAVYDRTMGQYVGPVVHGKSKPSQEDAQARAPRSTVAVVRV